ncbi:MAG: CDP-alcohol phosphatidyltransferase family protein [Clostridia bacterium]|nr:CDP-alcohol phosphatidyltransferase family protein [Clostridia bacterium]MBP5460111.1 CDP-alcohol phosphatidyltransferase family protein [Clostridia bacterium]
MNEPVNTKKTPIIGVWNLANCVTWLGIAAAVLAIYFALAGNARIAMLVFIVSGLCDLFDGRVARMFKRTDVEKAFGIQLDSFADTVSFVVFPAVFLLTLTAAPWAVVLAILYILAGITRLCWFDITTDGDTKYFAGVPVTYMALVLPLVFVIVNKAAPDLIPAFTAASLAVMGILYVLNIRVKKPGGLWYAIFGVLAIVLAVLLLVL